MFTTQNIGLPWRALDTDNSTALEVRGERRGIEPDPAGELVRRIAKRVRGRRSLPPDAPPRRGSSDDPDWVGIWAPDRFRKLNTASPNDTPNMTWPLRRFTMYPGSSSRPLTVTRAARDIERLGLRTYGDWSPAATCPCRAAWSPHCAKGRYASQHRTAEANTVALHSHRINTPPTRPSCSHRGGIRHNEPIRKPYDALVEPR